MAGHHLGHSTLSQPVYITRTLAFAQVSLRVHPASLILPILPLIHLDLRPADPTVMAHLLCKISIDGIGRLPIGVDDAIDDIHNLHITDVLMRAELDVGLLEEFLQLRRRTAFDFVRDKAAHLPVIRQDNAGDVGIFLPAVGSEAFERADVRVDFVAERLAAVLGFFGILVVAAVVLIGIWPQGVNLLAVCLDIGEVGYCSKTLEGQGLVGADLDEATGRIWDRKLLGVESSVRSICVWGRQIINSSICRVAPEFLLLGGQGWLFLAIGWLAEEG